MSWFFFPAAITFVVLFKYRQEFGSYVTWYLAAMYVSVLLFALAPMSPPWMADDSVHRILALRWDGEVHVDNNPVAAMPSLHVALPLTLTLWAFFKNHIALGAVAGIYTALTAVNVVYLGEHYVIDVLGAVIVAGGIFMAASLLANRPREITVLRPAVQPVERGQNLIEFAMLMPFVIALIGAVIMIGFALFTRGNVQQAVREGARQAAVGQPLSEVRDLAAGNSGGTLDPTDINWCLPPGSSGAVGDRIRVYVDDGNNGSEGFQYTVLPSTGIFQAMGMSAVTVTMSPRATARLEKSVSGVPACT
jgi:hypothetical protein